MLTFTYSLKKVQELEFLTFVIDIANTAQKMKFSIENFYSKCDQIRKKLRIWSHLLDKSLMENLIFLQ